MTEHRSDVFAFASAIVDRDAELDPIFATSSGIVDYDEFLPDFSPDATAKQLVAVREHWDHLATLKPSDDIDRIALAVMRERLETRRGLLVSGEAERLFGVLTSPMSEIRQVFELMSHESDDDLAVIATRLEKVRPALESWRPTLEELANSDRLPSRRHVLGVADQAATYATGTYARFVKSVSADIDDDHRLVRAANDADAACGELSAWLRDELAPRANERDFCGLDRYRVWSQNFTGAVLDFEELYAWGYADLQRINARMWEIANTLVPGATSLVEVADHLDHDPSRFIDGTDELLRRLISFTQQAIEKLDGVHFDIDPRIRFCDARLAPEGSAAAPYYIPPSEDLSRPGTTWYPTLGATTFSWWSDASTWYHEGVPGHHLQCATSIIEADRQSRFHRLEAWTSGYGEGWALYAERLMDELGFFEDLGEEMGFLSGQALRAARVMVDIGMHLQLRAPDDLGELADLGDCSGRVWTPEMAVAVLEERAIQSHEMSVSEVERYLGLPAQAISYKVGERVWMRSREEARERLGDDFSLKRFHAFALALGPMGLDPFEDEMRKWRGE
ncbi:MAG: DUF885 domain-containing protein [Acidimicrobiales bacterium]|jgi:uncharacterized protein (DUF885 family)